LIPALQWLVESLQARCGIAIGLEDDGRPKPADEQIRIILFRAIRELLINAVKHANARRIRVCLRCDADQFKAEIADDGVGMEVPRKINEGFGLLGVQERLAYIGGTMHIESVRGAGTRVHVHAPLSMQGPERARIAV
jgi:signal transduction histidine kinase